jgi:hypothetical protein
MFDTVSKSVLRARMELQLLMFDKVLLTIDQNTRS